MHKNPTFFLIVWLTCFFPAKLFAQECNCPLYNEDKIKELRWAKDSAGTAEAISRLNQSENTDCRMKALTTEIEYLLTFKKPGKVPELLRLQEELVQKKDKCRSELELQYFQNQSYYCKVIQNYEGLSKHSFALLELAERMKDAKKELTAIDFIVFLFTRQGQNEKNWDYIKRAEKIIYNLGTTATANNYNWLAAQYETKFAATQKMPLLDSALLFAAKARELAFRAGDYIELMKVYRVYEAGASHRNNYRQANAYIDSSLFYQRKLNIITNPASLHFTKAWNFMELKEFGPAQQLMDSSIYYAEKFEGKSPATMSIYQEAAKLYEQSGNIPRAYEVFKKYAQVKDSLFTIQRTEKINELEQKYNKAKNEKTIKELAQQKRIYLLLALAALLAVLAIAFFLRQQSLKHKKNILETEQRLNRARMNPHFFFNALTALQKFALRDNDGQAMASNLSKFSNIMRETLESTYKEYVTIEQEMEFLGEYLEVQKIRLPQTFSYSVSAEKNLAIDELQIPAMIIQPFVENSIEHGFAGVQHAGKISISFKQENKGLLIQILDNGKGLTTSVKENNEHISRASQIIKDRIYLLNIKLKTKAGFNIDNAEGGGVVVNIHLPLLYK